jgi:hypothetical protein
MTTMTTAELRSSVLSLATEERAALAHDLIATLTGPASVFWLCRTLAGTGTGKTFTGVNQVYRLA